MSKKLLFRLVVLMAAIMCALDASAAEAYACYTPSNTTLTFYYDNLRSSRTGTTYDLDSWPDWYNDGTNVNVTKAVFTSSFANARPTSTTSWFYGMNNLQSITGMSYLNTSEVTDMSGMFNGCSSLTSLDVSHFNTANVGNMSFMFNGCSSLTSLDLSNFNTANVTNMQTMFQGCTGLTSLDVSHFNTSKVTNMSYMFSGCELLTSLDLSSFNTGNVTTMECMFNNCSSLTSLDLSNFNTANVTNMAIMFSDCNSLTSLDVSHFNTSKVTNMSHMFRCKALTSLDLSSFNTSNVTDMGFMFYDCYALTSLDLSSFNTSKVTNMWMLFFGCESLKTIYVGNGWNTATVTKSGYMFSYCTSLVGGQGTVYDPAHVGVEYAHIDGGPSNPGYFTEKSPEAYACYTPGNTTLTFYYDKHRSSRTGTTYDLNTGDDIPGWYTDNTNVNVTMVVFDSSFAYARPTSTCAWFGDMSNLTSITGLSYLNTENVTNMLAMFYNCDKLTNIDVSHFNTANVTNMQTVFQGCTGLTSIDVSNFNTSNVTTMAAMFDDCSGLTSLNVSNFNTANVTQMHQMFRNCSGLTSLDVSNFNTSNVSTMNYMFNGCTNLTTIYAGSGWTTNAVIMSNNMFRYCTKLVGGQGTTFDANHIDATYARIDGGPSNPGYFTEAIAASEAYAVYTEDNTTLTFYYDSQRSTRPGTTYGLNLGNEGMEWHETAYFFTQVVFDPSFADARPTTTSQLFEGMSNVRSITGLEYLNTDSVTDMSSMFDGCRSLTSVDLSHFNTSNVTSMYFMFANCRSLTSLDLSSFNTDNVTTMECMFLYSMGLTSVDLSGFTNARVERTSNMFEGCYALTTIYADSGWNLPADNYSFAMFADCTSLVGGKGTTYDANHMDAEYAHIDGGPSNPGYFTEKAGGLRGDVNGDSSVNIADVTTLIDLLLGGATISNPAADCNKDGSVNIADVTALIDYLLSGTWN